MKDGLFEKELKQAYNIWYEMQKAWKKWKILSIKWVRIPKEIYDMEWYRLSYWCKKMILIKYLEWRKSYLETSRDAIQCAWEYKDCINFK